MKVTATHTRSSTLNAFVKHWNLGGKEVITIRGPGSVLACVLTPKRTSDSEQYVAGRTEVAALEGLAQRLYGDGTQVEVNLI